MYTFIGCVAFYLIEFELAMWKL